MSAARSARILRRRFDRTRDLPTDVIALGGSVCSFDPLYGQDLEAAVLEAAALARILGDQHSQVPARHSIELPPRYFRAVTQLLDGALRYDLTPALKTVR